MPCPAPVFSLQMFHDQLDVPDTGRARAQTATLDMTIYLAMIMLYQITVRAHQQ